MWRRSVTAGLGLIVSLAAASVIASESETLLSPNGKVEVTVRQVDAGLEYSVCLDGKDVLRNSPLGFVFKSGKACAPSVTIQSVNRGGVNSTWKPVWGKRSEVVDHYQEMTLQLRETAATDKSISLIVRAYDNGVALRYSVPEASGEFELNEDLTGFRFPEGAKVWAANFGGFHAS